MKKNKLIFLFVVLCYCIFWVKAEGETKLEQKIVPLTNNVYKIFDYYEAKGVLRFLPQAKPYDKQTVIRLLNQIQDYGQLSVNERKTLERSIDDFNRETNAVQVYKTNLNESFALSGVGAESSFGSLSGKEGTWTTSHLIKPFISGDLGKHITFHATLGAAIEKLAPDMFFESYTKNKMVNFPYKDIGYAYLPYQFNFETLTSHSALSDKRITINYFTNGLSVGWTHFSELNGSWFNGALKISLNNQRRAWGNDFSNLVLSSTARRFPGIELKVEPARWMRYSYLTGSLFNYNNYYAGYKQNIYGYDIGDVQKNFTLHLLEITPLKWLQVSAGAGNIWSKRFELAYLIPFTPFAQLEAGDQDNMYINFDVSVQIPRVGKAWFSGFIDEFSFDVTENAFRLPRNRYAWQTGWKSTLLSSVLPGTSSTFKYTRLTPFVYTHYPDDNFNQFSTRPVDQTYTNDGFNLGFYLPPNSGEFDFSLQNIAVTDLILTFNSKLILHGTNDLASPEYNKIFGDIYRHQFGNDIFSYPLLDFTHDGIYDKTLMATISFDWKIRNFVQFLRYFRLTGSVGVSKTTWTSNKSGVTAPQPVKSFNGNLSVLVDI